MNYSNKRYHILDIETVPQTGYGVSTSLTAFGAEKDMVMSINTKPATTNECQLKPRCEATNKLYALQCRNPATKVVDGVSLCGVHIRQKQMRL